MKIREEQDAPVRWNDVRQDVEIFGYRIPSVYGVNGDMFESWKHDEWKMSDSNRMDVAI